MTAPHFHNTAEAKSAIKKIEHNTDGGNGAPTSISGGSAGNRLTSTPGVNTGNEKGSDYVNKGKK